jgi:hypothetical protein
MAGEPKSDDQKSRKDAAESLSDQIDDIVTGRATAGTHKSFRDFIEHKMAEDRRTAVGSSAGPPTGKRPEDNDPDKIPQRRE